MEESNLDKNPPVNNSSQNNIPQTQQPVEGQVVNNASSSLSKPIWKTDVFIVLAIVVFWPIGLILMWKYASWRKLIKGLVSFFLLLGIIPLILIWGLIFGIKGYQSINNTLNLKVANKSIKYKCEPIDSTWEKCLNSKYKISFEYPLSWNYIDFNNQDEEIGFTPLAKDIRDNIVIYFSIYTIWESEDKARQFVDGFGIGNRQKISISGFYATKEELYYKNKLGKLFVAILDGKKHYQFDAFVSKLKEKGIVMNDEEFKLIFYKMANSFRKE